MYLPLDSVKKWTKYKMNGKKPHIMIPKIVYSSDGVTQLLCQERQVLFVCETIVKWK